MYSRFLTISDSYVLKTTKILFAWKQLATKFRAQYHCPCLLKTDNLS